MGYVQSETTASPSLARRRFGMGALQTRLFRADPDAEEGRWIEEMRERRPHPLGARDWQVWFVGARGFLAFPGISAVFIRSYRSAPPVPILYIPHTYSAS